MTQLNILSNPVVKMNSIALCDVINQARRQHGETEVRRNDFTARCLDELQRDDYETFVVTNPNGTETEVVIMTWDQCMYVAMRESKMVRRIVMEKLKQGAAPAVPQSLSAALRLAADQADQIEAQQAQLAIAAPKVAFVDRYVESTGLKGFREVCKLLGANESRFREFLTDNKIMYRLGGSMTAHAQHLYAGRFEVRAGASEVSGHAFNACKFTSKGVEWVAGEWAKHQIRAEVAA